MPQRQIVLDTETTGLDISQGHRIIEIGCVELIDRKLSGKHFHKYINPRRKVDPGAFKVHGISDSFLIDKPFFEDIVDEFLSFISGADLIIHNAHFDVGFINNELKLIDCSLKNTSEICSVIDSLKLARDMHLGQKNSLDALCKRYSVDNSKRELHGALLDAEILADVYLLMTGGQTSFLLDDVLNSSSNIDKVVTDSEEKKPLSVPCVSKEEENEHKKLLEKINKISDGKCLWLAKNN